MYVPPSTLLLPDFPMLTQSFWLWHAFCQLPLCSLCPGICCLTPGSSSNRAPRLPAAGARLARGGGGGALLLVKQGRAKGAAGRGRHGAKQAARRCASGRAWQRRRAKCGGGVPCRSGAGRAGSSAHQRRDSWQRRPGMAAGAPHPMLQLTLRGVLPAVLLLRCLQRGRLCGGAARLVLLVPVLPPLLLQKGIGEVACGTRLRQVPLSSRTHAVIQRLGGWGWGWGGGRVRWGGGERVSTHAAEGGGADAGMCPSPPCSPGIPRPSHARTCRRAAVWMRKSWTLVSAPCSACRPSAAWPPPCRRPVGDGRGWGDCVAGGAGQQGCRPFTCPQPQAEPRPPTCRGGAAMSQQHCLQLCHRGLVLAQAVQEAGNCLKQERGGQHRRAR